MAYDYTQEKTPIFTGINDSPQQATASEGSNASDLIAKVNNTLDNLVSDFNALENTNPDVWDFGTVFYLDTANGDDTNDSLTNSTPKATLQSVWDKVAEKAVDNVVIEQLDNNRIVWDTTLDFDKIAVSTSTDKSTSNDFSGVIRFKNLFINFSIQSSGNWFSDDESASPWRSIRASSKQDFVIEFDGCDITCSNTLILDSVLRWSFVGCDFDDSGASLSYYFFVVSSYKSANYLLDFVEIAFLGCNFDATNNGMFTPWMPDLTNAEITARACDFTDNFSQLFNFGTFFPLSSDAIRLRYYIYQNTYNGFTGTLFATALFRAVERSVYLIQGFTGEFGNIETTATFNLDKVNLVEMDGSIKDSQITALQNTISQLESTVTDLSLKVNAPSVKSIILFDFDGRIEKYNDDGTLDWNDQIQLSLGGVDIDQKSGFIYTNSADNSFNTLIEQRNLSDGVSQQQVAGAGGTDEKIIKRGDFVYAVTGSATQKFDVATLTEQYNTQINNQGVAGIHVTDSGEMHTAVSVSGNGDDQFWKLDASGNILLQTRIRPSGDNIVYDFAVDKNGRYFAVVEDGISNEAVIRFDPSDGSELWKTSYADMGAVAVSPLNDLFVTTNDGSNKFIKKLDPEDGTELESHTVTAFTLNVTSYFAVGLNNGNLKLYIFGEDGSSIERIYKFDWASKSVDWSSELVNLNNTIQGLVIGES